MDSIKEFASSILKLGDDAVNIYKPIVDDLIVRKSSDVNEIEHTLDYMLSFCFNKEMVLLYQRLCKHLYTINENAAFFYANEYYEMYVKEEG